ncbi:phage holin family protein [Mycetohabitans sp. B46]|uniref:phage holin family protein n=1 Tax=Mycetohabitans sp. B46 TaxID=2772536 RepID=UPI00307F7178
MSHDTQSPLPIHSSLRRLIGSVSSLLQTRLELVGIELAEEKERLLGVLFAGLAAMMFATMALVTLTVLIAAAFWETYRWQALAMLTVLYVIAALVCVHKARSGVRRAPLIFEETLAEFDKDRAIFRKPSP